MGDEARSASGEFSGATGWVRRGVQGLERQLQPARERRPHSGDRGRAPTRGDFIAILSPGYLASAWCRDEARLFTQHFAGDLTGRVFVLEKARLDDAVTVPQGLKGLRGYRFWFVDVDKQPRTFAMPMPQQGEYNIFGRSMIWRATFIAGSGPWPAPRCSSSRRGGR